MDASCQKEACNLQNCIQRNQYNQSKCEEYINSLLKCCNLWYSQNGSESKESPNSCPQYSILLRQMKDRQLL
ncbi:mitochondrial intermembrane space protein [Schizosaccharomyces osmophilus]|uniref:Cx9C motif-containing protein 4, mitochondrial n=1 Tax=Schizosaccharomyces osmophilus TaxID=2545709 RepID=A0AAF0AX45_9SCHI|nr:mitochondrial intermembrane space protein [Schizosaccharomyces osmophilus]WBW74417.1 mitochondrial intermembrane space protein [Schizosaccharomyces osmophilus]